MEINYSDELVVKGKKSIFWQAQLLEEKMSQAGEKKQ